VTRRRANILDRLFTIAPNAVHYVGLALLPHTPAGSLPGFIPLPLSPLATIEFRA